MLEKAEEYYRILSDDLASVQTNLKRYDNTIRTIKNSIKLEERRDEYKNLFSIKELSQKGDFNIYKINNEDVLYYTQASVLLYTSETRQALENKLKKEDIPIKDISELFEYLTGNTVENWYIAPESFIDNPDSITIDEYIERNGYIMENPAEWENHDDKSGLDYAIEYFDENDLKQEITDPNYHTYPLFQIMTDYIISVLVIKREGKNIAPSVLEDLRDRLRINTYICVDSDDEYDRARTDIIKAYINYYSKENSPSPSDKKQITVQTEKMGTNNMQDVTFIQERGSADCYKIMDEQFLYSDSFNNGTLYITEETAEKLHGKGITAHYIAEKIKKDIEQIRIIDNNKIDYLSHDMMEEIERRLSILENPQEVEKYSKEKDDYSVRYIPVPENFNPDADPYYYHDDSFTQYEYLKIVLIKPTKTSIPCNLDPDKLSTIRDNEIADTILTFSSKDDYLNALADLPAYYSKYIQLIYDEKRLTGKLHYDSMYTIDNKTYLSERSSGAVVRRVVTPDGVKTICSEWDDETVTADMYMSEVDMQSLSDEQLTLKVKMMLTYEKNVKEMREKYPFFNFSPEIARYLSDMAFSIKKLEKLGLEIVYGASGCDITAIPMEKSYGDIKMAYNAIDCNGTTANIGKDEEIIKADEIYDDIKDAFRINDEVYLAPDKQSYTPAIIKPKSKELVINK